jgi:hypothetical protein
MKSQRDPDVLIRAFLEDGITELPDRSYDVVRSTIDHTRQRFDFGPWREQQVANFAKFALAAAAVVLVAVIGSRFLPGNQGIGGQPTPTSTPVPGNQGISGQPTPTSTPAPTTAPSTAPTAAPSPTDIVDPSGRLQPGITYVALPFDSISGMDAEFRFEVPSANWDAHRDPGTTMHGMEYAGSQDVDGVGVGFLKVDSLNSDACHWTTDEDIEIGPTANDLMEALRSSDQFETQEVIMPDTVPFETRSIRVIMPNSLDVTACDDGEYHIWNGEGFDIYAQGPSNLWQVSIFEQWGERYIVMGSSMPDTPDEVLVELREILRSVRIDAAPTEAPSPPAAAPLPDEGTLVEGAYIFEVEGSSVSLSAMVPGGWRAEFGTVIGPNGWQEPGGVTVGFVVVDGLLKDPCHWSRLTNGEGDQLGDVPVGPAAIDLVNALVASSAFTTTEGPNPATLGSYPGYAMEIQLPDGLDLMECDLGDFGLHHHYLGFSGPRAAALKYAEDREALQQDLVIADVSGTRVVAYIHRFPDTPDADLDAARAILESVEVWR